MAKKRLTTIIKENVRSLRDLHPDISGQRAFAKECKVGEGTIWRIDNEQKRGASPETLEAIAERFRLQPWHLLIEGLDPRHPPELTRARAAAPYPEATVFESDARPRQPVRKAPATPTRKARTVK